MASLVTHYFFGRRLFPTLAYAAQKIISAYPDHYTAGCQGPDIFFYHLTSKKHIIGEKIHARPLIEFIEKNHAWIDAGPRLSPTWAYFFGFLTHFSLDIAVHPYIDRIEKKISLDHVAIERDFDRLLLEEEGYDPTAFHSRNLLPAPAAMAVGIEPLYAPYHIHRHDIHRAMASFRLGQQFFHVDGEKTYTRKHKLLKMFGRDAAFGGMLLCPEGYPASIYITNPVMKELMTAAYPIAQKAVCAFIEATDYPSFFELNFNGK